MATFPTPKLLLKHMKKLKKVFAI